MNKIGRISPSGAVTEYPVPFTAGSIGSIAAGPDGALWFAESSPDPNSGSKIGRITTAGILVEYALPFSNPVGAITAGSDGAIWFTESIAGRIGRITPPPAGTTPVSAAPPTSVPPDFVLGGAKLSISDQPMPSLSWLTGAGETGYTVLRLSGGGVTALPVPASQYPEIWKYFSDPNAPNGFSCYLVSALVGSPPAPSGAVSDLLCTTHGLAPDAGPTAPGAPLNFTLRLNQTSTAMLNWYQPNTADYDGYLLVTLGGSSRQLDRNAMSASIPIDGPTCFVLETMRGGTPIGYSEILCGVPGVSNREAERAARRAGSLAAGFPAVPDPTPTATPSGATLHRALLGEASSVASAAPTTSPSATHTPTAALTRTTAATDGPTATPTPTGPLGSTATPTPTPAR